MHRHIDFAPQGRPAPADGSPVKDLASALAALAFCAAISFVLAATLLPELPA